jgi:hypothetical protein
VFLIAGGDEAVDLRGGGGVREGGLRDELREGGWGRGLA